MKGMFADVFFARGSDGKLSVVNGLGVPIRNLWLADEKRLIYTASSIAPGAATTLQITTEHPATGKSGALRSAFAGDWLSLVQKGGSGGDLARPRTYIAELEGCPFLEEGLKGVKQKKCEGTHRRV